MALAGDRGIQAFTLEEVKKHNQEKDAWVVMDGEVFDVTKFLNEHPGGSTIVLPHLGSDIREVMDRQISFACIQML
jgi:cytochrome b involved in lipid metabolism